MQTYAYGFPRLGAKREYKNIIEIYWAKKIKKDNLLNKIKELEEQIFTTYAKYVDRFPVGEMTLYDKMLDTALLLGIYKIESLTEYYRLCRGKKALEMTKWFNTNYHYLIPEIKENIKPAILYSEIKKLKETCSKYKQGVPYFIGPFTFLKLSKGIKPEKFNYNLMNFSELYCDIVKEFNIVHIDEPALVFELTEQEITMFMSAYSKICKYNPSIYIFTYYDSVDSLKKLYELPVKGIALDFINGKENLLFIKNSGFPEDKVLIAGIVNGRNIWKTNIYKTLETLNELSRYAKNLIISNGSPLYHLPVSIKAEKHDKPILKKLAFAEERLAELKLFKKILLEERIKQTQIDEGFGNYDLAKTKYLKDEDFNRTTPYNIRAPIQQKSLNLPLFPATTIGSFPQTPEIRKLRNAYKNNEISHEKYTSFIKDKIKAVIKLQEELGLDVLVHGEFERSDMVEFFAEKLQGFETTENGWVISYGTRTYRPPIILGNVGRTKPMTVDFIKYAQSLTKKPVKGIITGPVTIITWSYLRQDIAIEDIAYQIALTLKEEIKELEDEGIKIIQIDEPAFKEGAPLKKRNWQGYFNWAVKSFNLAISQARPETQIHTHMCYSEFGEIIEYIQKMDFDVISIETARSRGDIIESFKNANFIKQIGLGVWDVHSHQIPKPNRMMKIINKAKKIFSPQQLWINPDCGLKTRDFKETIEGLKNMMKAVEIIRNR